MAPHTQNHHSLLQWEVRRFPGNCSIIISSAPTFHFPNSHWNHEAKPMAVRCPHKWQDKPSVQGVKVKIRTRSRSWGGELSPSQEQGSWGAMGTWEVKHCYRYAQFLSLPIKISSVKFLLFRICTNSPASVTSIHHIPIYHPPPNWSDSFAFSVYRKCSCQFPHHICTGHTAITNQWLSVT